MTEVLVKWKANAQYASHIGCTKDIGFLLFLASLFNAAKTTILKIDKPNYWF